MTFDADLRTRTARLPARRRLAFFECFFVIVGYLDLFVWRVTTQLGLVPPESSIDRAFRRCLKPATAPSRPTRAPIVPIQKQGRSKLRQEWSMALSDIALHPNLHCWPSGGVQIAARNQPTTYRPREIAKPKFDISGLSKSR